MISSHGLYMSAGLAVAGTCLCFLTAFISYKIFGTGSSKWGWTRKRSGYTSGNMKRDSSVLLVKSEDVYAEYPNGSGVPIAPDDLPLSLRYRKVTQDPPNCGVRRESIKPKDEYYEEIKSNHKYSVIGATYGIFDTGTNIQRLDLGVECTPRG
jgi:hypothetical protein